MKKLSAIVMAAGLALSLAACSSGSSTASTSSSEASSSSSEASSAASSSEASSSAAAASDLNVAVFYYTYADTYISSVRTALDSALGGKSINYQDYDGNGNQTTQNEYIDTAITNGANLLIVNMVTSGSEDVANEIISKANGMPVIFFNRAIEADGDEGTILNANDNICFVGTDAPEAGHLQGQMIGEYLVANYDAVDLNGDGVISYAMFKGDEANVEAIYRTQYGVEDANAILTENGYPELEYFDSNASEDARYQVDLNGQWSAQAAQDYMQTNLASYNEANNNMIELVICNNDNMAEGAITALQAAGYNNGEGTTTIPVFGVDATESAQELIGDGYMTGTVKQDAEGMANAIADIAEAVGQGTAIADAVSTVAGSADMYSIAEGIPNKLYVAYAPYTQ